MCSKQRQPTQFFRSPLSHIDSSNLRVYNITLDSSSFAPHSATTTPKKPTAPTIPAAITPVGLDAPACELELLAEPAAAEETPPAVVEAILELIIDEPLELEPPEVVVVILLPLAPLTLDVALPLIPAAAPAIFANPVYVCR